MTEPANLGRREFVKWSAAEGQWGPGHNSFTVDASGADVLVYHARSCRPAPSPARIER